MANMYDGHGYPQVELNQCAFRRDGRIEAQCKLDATDFATDKAFNGTILAVDNVNRVIKYPTADAKLFALNYTTEHMYDERTPGLKNFALERGTFLPRLGYLAKGDKFTTNAVVIPDSYTVEKGDQGYIAAGNKGLIALAKAGASVEAIEGAPTFIVAAVTTMPDGAPAVKLQVVTD